MYYYWFSSYFYKLQYAKPNFIYAKNYFTYSKNLALVPLPPNLNIALIVHSVSFSDLSSWHNRNSLFFWPLDQEEFSNDNNISITAEEVSDF